MAFWLTDRHALRYRVLAPLRSVLLNRINRDGGVKFATGVSQIFNEAAYAAAEGFRRRHGDRVPLRRRRWHTGRSRGSVLRRVSHEEDCWVG